MHMKKKSAVVIAALIAIILPALSLVVAGACIPAQFSETYLGALTDKVARLDSAPSPKIVVIGGSAVAFGIDCDMIREYTGMDAVNFGLYATLGTKAMLDQSRAGIREGDIIVIAPELDAQTLSLYFNASSMWQAADCDASLLLRVGRDNIGALAAEYFSHLGSCYKYMKAGGLAPSGVYQRSSFDENGDIGYERPGNIMALGYDPSTVINPLPGLYGDGFIEYVNDYISYAKRKGAAVYWSFPPVNASAVSPDMTEESLADFFAYTASALNCEVITDPRACMLDRNYFYDSNYHLNDAGVTIYTASLIGDLRRVLGDTTALSIELPDPPEPVAKETVQTPSQDDKDWASLYTYEEYGDAFAIAGVTSEGKALDALVTPSAADGRAVIAVSAGAFDGCAATEITIAPNIVKLMDGAFSGCSELERVYIKATDPSMLSVTAGLLDGANETFEFIFTRDAYLKFISDYFWGPFAGRMAVAE